MSFDVAGTVKTGFDRVGTRNAAIIASVYFVLNVLNRAISDTLISKSVSQLPGAASEGATLALPLPGYVAGFLLIPIIAASAALGVAAFRLFSTDEKNIIPKEIYSENIGKPVINVIVGGIAFITLMMAVFLIPVIPGLLTAMAGFRIPGIIVGLIGLLVSLIVFTALLVKLYFWTAAVAIDNDNFIKGFKTSWNLTKENGISVGLLLLVIISISLFMGAVFSIPRLLGFTVAGAITSSLGSAIASTLGAAIIATAYGQLKEVRDRKNVEEGIEDSEDQDKDENKAQESEDSESEIDEEENE